MNLWVDGAVSSHGAPLFLPRSLASACSGPGGGGDDEGGVWEGDLLQGLYPGAPGSGSHKGEEEEGPSHPGGFVVLREAQHP